MIAILGIFIVFFVFLFSPVKVFAQCPVCVVAIGAGVGFSRFLGIDDTVSGTWIGGLMMSMSFWFANWMKKKQFKIPFKTILSIIVTYLFSIVPLFFTGIVGHELNRLWGIDKLILGIVFGSFICLTSVIIDKFLRTKNNGKVYISFQKVIIPVSLLILTSIIFYFITKSIN